MHEMGVAVNILEIVKQEMLRHKATKLISICLAIGKFTAIVPHSLTFCFEVITKGTFFENVKLIIEKLPLIGRCINCDSEFAIKEYSFICEKCGSNSIEIVSGRELFIKEIEID
jgi:hydrogenase nickel incorporation protein HypA/HybF